MTTESTNKKVLVVEDNDATLAALHDVLVKEGFTVFEAKNGLDGAAVALRERPDLILLDILMPVMDGWEMLKQVRESGDWGKCVPVIVLTNLSGDEDAQIRHIADLGPSFFLTKVDWKLESVIDKVTEILNSPRIPCP